MSKLISGTPIPVLQGKHAIVIAIGTGTALIDINADGLGWAPLVLVQSASDNLTANFPHGLIRATLTGDAQVSISRSE